MSRAATQEAKAGAGTMRRSSAHGLPRLPTFPELRCGLLWGAGGDAERPLAGSTGAGGPASLVASFAARRASASYRCPVTRKGAEAVVVDGYSDDGEVTACLLHLIDQLACVVEGPRGGTVYPTDIRLRFFQ